MAQEGCLEHGRCHMYNHYHAFKIPVINLGVKTCSSDGKIVTLLTGVINSLCLWLQLGSQNLTKTCLLYMVTHNHTFKSHVTCKSGITVLCCIVHWAMLAPPISAAQCFWKRSSFDKLTMIQLSTPSHIKLTSRFLGIETDLGDGSFHLLTPLGV